MYASTAAIPIIGPILASAAAAVAYGAVEAFSAFDVGSWALPSDMLAQVHAGEMIVPRGRDAMGARRDVELCRRRGRQHEQQHDAQHQHDRRFL